jgi:7-cyano-7-deazaguanine reductase
MAKKKVKTSTESKVGKRSKNELKQLGLGNSQTTYLIDYDPKLLESFPNKNPKCEAWTTFLCSEFTSLCPKTNQPDFARIYINYIADKTMVESKSLKLYLFSFRNHGDFHEDCIQTICDDLSKLMKPKFIEVIGEFTPRGGIAIYPYCSASNSSAKFKKIKESRFMNYSPGKYTIPLSRVY